MIDDIQGIECLTGIDTSFYPTYDTTDPYASYLRGYYFTSTSYLQLPPHGEDSSYSLVLAAENSISIWLRPQDSDGVIFSKQDKS